MSEPDTAVVLFRFLFVDLHWLLVLSAVFGVVLMVGHVLAFVLALGRLRKVPDAPTPPERPAS